jgi:hypothetical protein
MLQSLVLVYYEAMNTVFVMLDADKPGMLRMVIAHVFLSFSFSKDLKGCALWLLGHNYCWNYQA